MAACQELEDCHASLLPSSCRRSPLGPPSDQPRRALQVARPLRLAGFSWSTACHGPRREFEPLVSDLGQALRGDRCHLVCLLTVFAPFLLATGCMGSGERGAALRKQTYTGGQVEKVREDISGDAAVTGSTLGWEIEQKQPESRAVAVSLLLRFASRGTQNSLSCIILMVCSLVLGVRLKT